jgi:hypothetical protein
MIASSADVVAASLAVGTGTSRMSRDLRGVGLIFERTRPWALSSRCHSRL